MRRPLVSILVLVAALPAATSCSRPGAAEQATWEAIGSWPPGLRKCINMRDGCWDWRWTADDGTDGAAVLSVDVDGYHWRFATTPPATALRLDPAEPAWLAVRVPRAEDLAGTPPLPRLSVDSDCYTDLVSLLRALITPRFAGRVTHWPHWPVPVHAPAASSGGLDLAACLREAVMLWNEDDAPFFVWDDTATWGIRLAHYAGATRSPPMDFRITRLDSLGRPLRGRISVGDDYTAGEWVYALRAMAHELGHGTLLWGHSSDRGHLLWGGAPPLRAAPSRDERRAAALLRRLPAGLDLNRYEPPGEVVR